jgi:hypothetical protein
MVANKNRREKLLDDVGKEVPIFESTAQRPVSPPWHLPSLFDLGTLLGKPLLSDKMCQKGIQMFPQNTETCSWDDDEEEMKGYYSKKLRAIEEHGKPDGVAIETLPSFGRRFGCH